MPDLGLRRAALTFLVVTDGIAGIALRPRLPAPGPIREVRRRGIAQREAGAGSVARATFAVLYAGAKTVADGLVLGNHPND